MKAHELERGMIIVIPKYRSTHLGVKVATVGPGQFKSSTYITCVNCPKGYDVQRDTEIHVCPSDMVCEACEKVSDDLTYYDNGIFGHSGWMCRDCISTAEMEL